jgi:hypothetical protein
VKKLKSKIPHCQNKSEIQSKHLSFVWHVGTFIGIDMCILHFWNIMRTHIKFIHVYVSGNCYICIVIIPINVPTCHTNDKCFDWISDLFWQFGIFDFHFFTYISPFSLNKIPACSVVKEGSTLYCNLIQIGHNYSNEFSLLKTLVVSGELCTTNPR